MFKQKKQKNTAAENRLGANQKIGILFCAMVSAVATGYVPNYINLYYTDAVGISMGAVAMILDDHQNHRWCHGHYHGNDH